MMVRLNSFRTGLASEILENIARLQVPYEKVTEFIPARDEVEMGVHVEADVLCILV